MENQEVTEYPYTIEQSRLHKGSFAPAGKRYVKVVVKHKDMKYSSTRLLEMALINPATLKIIGDKMYLGLCEKYGI